MVMRQQCSECNFFKADTNSPAEAEGNCRRYPAYVMRKPDDWCGEFKRHHPVGKTFSQTRPRRPTIVPSGGTG